MRVVAGVAPDFVVSVSRLANHLAKRLAADPRLRRIGVSGEISGLSIQSSGTVYFDLKDRDALIKCVVWSETAIGLPALTNGQAVIAVGSVGTYTKKSTYQLTVYGIELEGAGRLHAVYEALKRRLESEGLFAGERKRALPAFPFRVALVSSRTANGAGDFLAQAATLAPHVSIEFFETPVQGENAASEIVRAIDRASRAAVDLVVLARGGGSFEDLFVFNDERVVRALARCAHPTVSAIGHEADAPLTDFVADHRAATPSTAAQTVLARRADLLQSIAACSQRLDRGARRNVERYRRELQRIELRSPLASGKSALLPRRQTLDMIAIDLARAVAIRSRAHHEALTRLRARLESCNPSERLSRRRERLSLVTYRLTVAARDLQAREARALATLAGRLRPAVEAGIVRRQARRQLIEAVLDGRDPTKILQRGYAIVSVAGQVVRDATALVPGTLVTARLAHGTIAARVETLRADGGE